MFLYHAQLDTHTHIQTHGRNPLDEGSAHRTDRYVHDSQQTQETNIHALSEIRGRDANNQAASDRTATSNSTRNTQTSSNTIAVADRVFATLEIVPRTFMSRIFFVFW